MKYNQKLSSGAVKAAWLAQQLDKEHLAVLCAMLPAEERRLLIRSLRLAGTLPDAMKNPLLHELGEAVGSGPVLSAGADKISSGFVGEDAVHGLVKAGCRSDSRDVWYKLNHLDAGALAQYLNGENPAVAAYVIARLATTQAAEVLAQMPEENAAEILKQITVAGKVSPEAAQSMEDALQKALLPEQSGGRQKATEILAALARDKEERILSEMDNRMPEVADTIRDSRLKFEDLASFSDTAVRTLLHHIEQDKLAAALRGASENVKKRFFANMPEISEKVICEDMRKAGPIKISEVENAQYEILQTVKNLAKSGQIVLQQPDI